MAQKLVVAGKASTAFEDGGSVAPIDLGVDMVYLNRADFERDYAGPVTDDPVSLGTLAAAGAKGLIVKVKSGACTIKFNGGTQAWPLAPGGPFVWANPSTPFPTSAAISTTGPAHVVFLAVG